MTTHTHSKESTTMATRNLPTTTDASTPEPRLPTDWEPHWPTLERDAHDPVYLAENDPVETARTTLADFGGIVPDEPDRVEVPIDTRDTTTQTSVFQYPCKWWRDVDRLEQLFDDRDLSMREISDLLGDDVGYEVVRTNLNDFGIRDPDEEQGLASILENGPADLVGDPVETDNSYTKYTKRGRSA